MVRICGKMRSISEKYITAGVVASPGVLVGHNGILVLYSPEVPLTADAKRSTWLSMSATCFRIHLSEIRGPRHWYPQNTPLNWKTVYWIV
jgi:hypothetical protein